MQLTIRPVSFELELFWYHFEVPTTMLELQSCCDNLEELFYNIPISNRPCEVIRVSLVCNDSSECM